MARTIKVALEAEEERRALAELALREYRSPSDQAAYLVIEGLRRAGVLRERDADHRPEAEAPAR